MKVRRKWRKLGWRHPLWDYVRFYSVVQKQKKGPGLAWIAKLKDDHVLEIDPTSHIVLPPEHVKWFFAYLEDRQTDFEHAKGVLRTEEEAVAFCGTLGVTVSKVRTKSEEHHQSSSALVAAVSSIASRECVRRGVTVRLQPDRRCVWLVRNNLHVTSRNLDGAIPSLAAPSLVWEIKEYWGKTKGGSKMSDAVYECNLVGRELREFEEQTGAKVTHVVFLDGKMQWSHRGSDLRRFIDLFHQGIIDHLIVGREVESEWQGLLASSLKSLIRG
jgi:hypothetical protein